LRSYFSDRKTADAIFGLLSYAASQFGFENLTEKEADKVIASHLKPLDEVIKSCFASTRASKKKKSNKKKDVEKKKRPNAIRSSPLYRKEEMEILSSLTSLIFTDLIDLNKDYEDQVFHHGFKAIEKRVHDTYCLRWETLSRFANRTKMRLQDIRKLIPNGSTLKKKDVTDNNVLVFLSSLKDPANRLVSEIEHILGGTDLVAAISYAYKIEFVSIGEAKAYLYNKALAMYMKTLPESKDINALKPKIEVREHEDIEFERGIKVLIRNQNRMGNLQKQSVGLATIKQYKLYGRCNIIAPLMKSMVQDLKTFDALSESVRDISVRIITEGKVLSDEAYHISFFTKVKPRVEYIYNTCRRLRNEYDNEDVTKHLDYVIKESEDVIKYFDGFLASS
jgi:hypothetical protein